MSEVSQAMKVLLAILAISSFAGFCLWQYDPPNSPGAVVLRQPLSMSEALQAQVLADKDVPDNAVVFLGDSNTVALDVHFVPVAVNYGIDGQRTRGLLYAMPYYGAIRRARAVVLSIGTNDVNHRDTADIEPRLRAIAAQIDRPLFWNAVPPTIRGDVRQVNAIIRRLCSEHGNCTYVQAPFERSDFYDGIHLNAQGYAHWIAAMQSQGLR